MKSKSKQWVVHLPGEGRAIEMSAFSMTLKASEADTGGAFTLLEATEPPDFGPPMHVHENAGEALYVLEGEYHVFIQNQVYKCPTGSFVYIPAGVVHSFRVGRIESRKLNFYSPAAMVDYFDGLAQAAAKGTHMSAQLLTDAAKKYGMRVYGPVPEEYS